MASVFDSFVGGHALARELGIRERDEQRRRKVSDFEIGAGMESLARDREKFALDKQDRTRKIERDDYSFGRDKVEDVQRDAEFGLAQQSDKLGIEVQQFNLDQAKIQALRKSRDRAREDDDRGALQEIDPFQHYAQDPDLPDEFKAEARNRSALLRQRELSPETRERVVAETESAAEQIRKAEQDRKLDESVEQMLASPMFGGMPQAQQKIQAIAQGYKGGKVPFYTAVRALGEVAQKSAAMVAKASETERVGAFLQQRLGGLSEAMGLLPPDMQAEAHRRMTRAEQAFAAFQAGVLDADGAYRAFDDAYKPMPAQKPPAAPRGGAKDPEFERKDQIVMRAQNDPRWAAIVGDRKKSEEHKLEALRGIVRQYEDYFGPGGGAPVEKGGAADAPPTPEEEALIDQLAAQGMGADEIEAEILRRRGGG